MVGMKGKSGRHKKICTCEKCEFKRHIHDDEELKEKPKEEAKIGC